MNPKFLRPLKVFGGVLSLGSLYFVGKNLIDSSHEIRFGDIGALSWVSLIIFSIIYGSLNICLAMAWRGLLRLYDIDTGARWALKTYGVSQIAKYFPGNIFHLAGRQVLSMGEGLPGKIIFKSALWELGFIALVALLFFPLALPLIFSEIHSAISITVFLGGILIVIAVLIPVFGKSMEKPFFWHLLFLFAGGMLFSGILECFTTKSFGFDEWFSICGAYVMAWLIGFVTPGAPAGIGMRELYLILIVGSLVPENELLLAITLGRMVTVFGDLLFFAGVRFIKTENMAEPH